MIEQPPPPCAFSLGGLLTAAGLGGDFTTGAAFFLATPPFAASAFARGVVARVAVVDAPGDFAGVAFFAGDLAFFAAFFGAFFAGVAFFAGDFAAAGAAFAGVLLVEARGVTGAGALAGVFFAAFFGPFFLVEPPPFWGGAFLAYFVGDGGGAGTRDRQRSEKDDFEFAGASWCVIPPRGDRIGRNARARPVRARAMRRANGTRRASETIFRAYRARASRSTDARADARRASTRLNPNSRVERQIVLWIFTIKSEARDSRVDARGGRDARERHSRSSWKQPS